MSAETAAAAETTRAPRGERNDSRRGGGPRNEREPRPAPTAEETIAAPQSFVDTLPGAAADVAPGTAEAGERDASRRRRRRGGRGRGRDEAGTDAVSMAAEDSPGSDQAAEFPPIVTESVAMKAPYAAEHEPARISLGEPEATPVPAPAPVVSLMAAPVARELPAPAAVAVAAPPAAPYQLPTDTLAAIASDAGLQWVNSDAEKIRAVQEAMASEPEPIHVPRQPKPPAVVDNGPLVLVETKKDLSQIRLPFDSTPPAAQ